MLRIEDLKAILTETQTPVLSLYLNINPGYRENQAETPAWRVWLKTALRDIENGLDRDQRGEWGAIRARAEEYFEYYRAESKGLVLFLSKDMLQTYPLPLPIENRAAYGDPLVTPLFWKLDEYERYLIVLVDQQESRFITAYLGHVDTKLEMEIDIEIDFRETSLFPGPADAQQDNLNSGRVAVNDEHRTRFYRHVVNQIAAISAENETNRLILGGSDAAHAVRALLPESLASGVVGLLPIPLKTPPHELPSLVFSTVVDYERQFEAALLDEVIGLAKAGGRGALGHDAVLKALEEKRVDLVIAPWPLKDESLLASLPSAALESGGTIELVHGEAAERLNDEGGLAARLYYTV